MMHVQTFFRSATASFIVLILAGCTIGLSGTSALPEDIPQGSYLLTMRAPDMFCGGCTGTVEAAVGATSGVIFVDADITTKEVSIIYDPSVVTSDSLLGHSIFDVYGREFVSDALYTPTSL